MSKPYSFMSQTEALDSVQNAKENSEQGYCDMVQSIIKSRPFGDHKFYLFQFWKRLDDVAGIKKMFHQPRLTRPEPIPGTTLLKCNPDDPGAVTIIWTLPNEQDFGLYKQGKMFANPFVWECIEKYNHLVRGIDRIQRNLKDSNNISNTKALEIEYENLLQINDLSRPDPDDLSDNQIREIYAGMKKKT